MRILNVAEKNDASKRISQILSHGNSSRREGKSKFNKIYEFQDDKRNTIVFTSVSGHLHELDFGGAYRGWQATRPSVLFDAPVQRGCHKNFVQIEQTLQNEAKRADLLVIWTDCDREGENIGYEVALTCWQVKPRLEVRRAIFSELTASALHRAMSAVLSGPLPRSDLNPPRNDLKMATVNAVNLRQELDLRIGCAFTRFHTLELRKHFRDMFRDSDILSYGSCQFPTLGFVVDRFESVENFIAEPFWRISLHHRPENTIETTFSWKAPVPPGNDPSSAPVGKIFGLEAIAQAIHEDINDVGIVSNPGNNIVVHSVTRRPKSRWRPVALDTVTLEKLASRKLRITAKQALEAAEKLYVEGLISYPRTETNQFSSSVTRGGEKGAKEGETGTSSATDLRTLVNNHRGHPDWGFAATAILDVQGSPQPRNGKNSDHAHPPIHPTKCVHPGSLQDPVKRKVYDLVCRHFLACVWADAKGFETKVLVKVADEGSHTSVNFFDASGLAITEKNFLEVYHPYEKWNASEIGVYQENQVLSPRDSTIELVASTTSPPSLLGEADLIALMEKHFIGTDATHAEHIEKIKSREYIEQRPSDRRLLPTRLGLGLVRGYASMTLAEATRPSLRAGLEAQLVDVCRGNTNPEHVLAAQINVYKELFAKVCAQFPRLVSTLGRCFGTDIDPNAIAPIASGRGGGDDGDDDGAGGGEMIDICPCPKCPPTTMMALRTLTSGSFLLGCKSYPDCQAAVFISGPVEVKRTQSCSSCSSGQQSYKVSLLLNTRPPAPFVLEDVKVRTDGSRLYQTTVCPRCEDKGLLGGLGLRWKTSNTVTPSQHSSVPQRDITRTALATSSQVFVRNPPLPDQTSANPSTVPNCQCGVPASRRKVTKESANKGRSFYSCGAGGQTGGGCKFFEWCQDNDVGGDVSTTSGGRRPSSVNASASTRGGRGGGRTRQPPKCTGCRQPGHNRKNCPNPRH